MLLRTMSFKSFKSLKVLRSKVCSDWPAIQCVVIGRIPQACDEKLHPSLYCNGVPQHNETKTIKPITNEAYVASSGNKITDYNDFY